MFARFSLRDVARSFPAKDFERGRRYFEQGRVRHFDVTENTGGVLGVRGEVLGSGGRVYTQEIDIEHVGDSLDVFSSCTCPVGFDCKHVVAVCLMARRYLSAASPVEDAEAADARLRRWLDRIDSAGAPAGRDDEQRLIYVLMPRDTPNAGLGIELRMVRSRKDGTFGKGRALRLDRVLDLLERPDCVQEDDRQVVRLLGALCPEIWDMRPEFRGRLGYLALEQLLHTGRCTFAAADNPPFEWGEPRRLDLAWVETSDGRLGLELTAGAGSSVLDTDPPLYVDGDALRVGPLETRLRARQVTELLAAPTLLAGDAGALARLLTNEFPELPLPAPSDGAVAEAAERQPLVPWLTLAGGRPSAPHGHELRLQFRYGGHAVQARPRTLQSLVDGAHGPLRVHRDLQAEDAALARLVAAGFELETDLSSAPVLTLTAVAATEVESASRWSLLVHDLVPALCRDGWEVQEDESFALRFEPADWHGVATPDPDAPNDWFSLRFDLEADGERWPLLPLLVPLLTIGFDRPLPPRVSLPITAARDGERRYLDLPTERLAPFLDALRDLFDAEQWRDGADTVALSRFDAAVVGRLKNAGTSMDVPAQLMALAERLADFSGIRQVAPPAGLRAELRGYQRHGLDWLQFLREYELGGILADDMGLGKTLQTLAHLLTEKQAGRLTRPALIVAPTSLMGNWRREAARFTPALSVLVLHGPDRHADFCRIPQRDLVLTTYPLLSRDRDALEQHAYHAVILDEAQTVKNPRSKAAVAVRALEARHRLCLTGTPMENHLGELWAQFDFLLPGFLGDADRFSRLWRRPIEEQGDEDRQRQLARRVAPFMLRRRKADVASELPLKTEILRMVALGDKQAGLYESVRLAMDEKVRRAVAAHGLARSHIAILDALLKLRQICCDPRLLKLPAAREVKTSAKLELLMQILPPMLEEGRRVLVFSQFTSMLEIIQAELTRRGIEFAKLTGQTRDRDGAVERFRSGAADVFLISLKAGGVGLNLTEADTVILYDPVVESGGGGPGRRPRPPNWPVAAGVRLSARHRRHGGGEDPGAAGRKRALAEGVYAGRNGGETAAFQPEDLDALLAPLG